MSSDNLALLLTGLFIFGEALALLIGAGFIIKPRPAWLSQKNMAFLADDLLFGAILILSATQVFQAAWIFWLSLISTFLSHVLRDAEFVGSFPNKFCDNTPLFIANNVKLVGLICSLLLHL